MWIRLLMLEPAGGLYMNPVGTLDDGNSSTSRSRVLGSGFHAPRWQGRVAVRLTATRQKAGDTLVHQTWRCLAQRERRASCAEGSKWSRRVSQKQERRPVVTNGVFLVIVFS